MSKLIPHCEEVYAKRLEDDLLEGEKTSPLYNIDVRWEENIGVRKPEDLISSLVEGMPPGRMKNGTSFNYFAKMNESLDDIYAYLYKDWTLELLKKYPDAEIDNLQTTVKWIRNDTWCLGWFNHYSYNTHLKDEDLLLSFKRYVDRVLHINEIYKYTYAENYEDTYICLMGAEDHWRWRGEDGKDSKVCRCKGCVESGRVFINH